MLTLIYLKNWCTLWDQQTEMIHANVWMFRDEVYVLMRSRSKLVYEVKAEGVQDKRNNFTINEIMSM